MVAHAIGAAGVPFGLAPVYASDSQGTIEALAAGIPAWCGGRAA